MSPFDRRTAVRFLAPEGHRAAHGRLFSADACRASLNGGSALSARSCARSRFPSSTRRTARVRFALGVAIRNLADVQHVWQAPNGDPPTHRLLDAPGRTSRLSVIVPTTARPDENYGILTRSDELKENATDKTVPTQRTFRTRPTIPDRPALRGANAVCGMHILRPKVIADNISQRSSPRSLWQAPGLHQVLVHLRACASDFRFHEPLFRTLTVVLRGKEIDAFLACRDLARPIVLLYGPDAGLRANAPTRADRACGRSERDPFRW